MYLSKYLLEEERVVGAMLDSKKLLPEGGGKYKYTVTSFKVFQLDINPVVSIAVENKDCNGSIPCHALFFQHCPTHVGIPRND